MKPGRHPGHRPLRAGSVALLSAVLLSGTVAACSSEDPNSIGAQARAGDRKGYLAGDGTIEQVAIDKRTTRLALTGTTVDGKRWSSAEQGAGKVVVVNVWGSWCPPCVAETPGLQRAWAAYQSAGAAVAFVGVAIEESAETSLAFLTKSGVTYPSISDRASDGAPIAALAGLVPATPSTLIVDRSGRVAARVSGPISEATLRSLIDDVLAES